MLGSALVRRRLFLGSCLRGKPLPSRSYAVAPSPELSEAELNIHNKLNDKFNPTELAVQDVSGEFPSRIRGLVLKNGSVGGCGTFYAISIASEAFRGLSTVKQHRLVNEILKEEIEGIHGLQVRVS